MPEGDTIHRAAATLDRVLRGDIVTRFESAYPTVSRVADDHPIVGRTIETVLARGKHLLMAFSGGLTLRTHMRMNGSWHIYPTGARWQRPAGDMRVLVATARAVAVGFNVPEAELLTGREIARHRALTALGPDLLDPTFDAREAGVRLRRHAAEAIAEVLLNQRVVAGIGNVFKSEILFLAGVHPFRGAGSLDDSEVDRILAIAREQLAANVLTRSQSLTLSIGRRTTRSIDPNKKLWVYSRGGQPCRRCRTRIESQKTGPDARVTYWCPRCQPAPQVADRR